MKLINKTRKLEIFKISLGQYLYALSLGLFFVALKIVTYTCLISFVLLGNALNGEIVFLSLAILNKISFLSLYNAHFMRHIINGLVSSNRITEFLLLPESNSEVPEKTIGSGTAKIQIRNLFATYQSIDHSKSDKNDLTITLNNINFECKSGELVTVIGELHFRIGFIDSKFLTDKLLTLSPILVLVYSTCWGRQIVHTTCDPQRDEHITGKRRSGWTNFICIAGARSVRGYTSREHSVRSQLR